MRALPAAMARRRGAARPSGTAAVTRPRTVGGAPGIRAVLAATAKAGTGRGGGAGGAVSGCARAWAVRRRSVRIPMAASLRARAPGSVFAGATRVTGPSGGGAGLCGPSGSLNRPGPALSIPARPDPRWALPEPAANGAERSAAGLALTESSQTQRTPEPSPVRRRACRPGRGPVRHKTRRPEPGPEQHKTRRPEPGPEQQQDPSSGTRPRTAQDPSSGTRPRTAQDPSSGTRPRTAQDPLPGTRPRTATRPVARNQAPYGGGPVVASRATSDPSARPPGASALPIPSPGRRPPRRPGGPGDGRRWPFRGGGVLRWPLARRGRSPGRFRRGPGGACGT